MTRVDLDALRKRAEKRSDPAMSMWRSEVLALVEAVEAAQAVAESTRGQEIPYPIFRALDRLFAALAQLAETPATKGST